MRNVIANRLGIGHRYVSRIDRKGSWAPSPTHPPQGPQAMMSPESMFAAALDAQHRHRKSRRKGEPRFRIAMDGWLGGKTYDLGHGLVGKVVARSQRESSVEVTAAAVLACLVVLGVCEQDGEWWRLTPKAAADVSAKVAERDAAEPTPA